MMKNTDRARKVAERILEEDGPRLGYLDRKDTIFLISCTIEDMYRALAWDGERDGEFTELVQLVLGELGY